MRCYTPTFCKVGEPILDASVEASALKEYGNSVSMDLCVNAEIAQPRRRKSGSRPSRASASVEYIAGRLNSTKRLGEGVLVLKQNYQTLKDARSVEYKLKKLKCRDYIAKIVQDGYIKIVP